MTTPTKLTRSMLLLALALGADALAKPIPANSKPVVREDVRIVNISDEKQRVQGWLTTGYGAPGGHIGPEYAFGFVVGDTYEENMVNFVKYIRKDLSIAELPFVIANTGMGGWTNPPQYKAKVEKLMDAQLALADPKKYPEFKGNVAGVETRDFQRKPEESPSKQDFHWLRNRETLYLIGKSMGDAMIDLESGSATTSK